jgi:uncharacterized protein YfaS (alpha-2-macroglobulin family)
MLPVTLLFVQAFSLLLCVSLAAASPSLTLGVQTDKSQYSVSDDISVYGSVFSGGAPLSGVNVALEVHDPAESPVIVRSLQTNSSGVYSLIFKLTPEASTGRYNVYASCTYGGETASNSTSFLASALAITIVTGKQSYNVGESVMISGKATLNSIGLQHALVALEVQDPNVIPIIVRVLETDSQGSYSLTFQTPTDSLLGIYKAFASVNYQGAVFTAVTSFTLNRLQVSADINGDGKINILDLTLVALAFGSHQGEPRWDPRCDLDSNGAINIIDITLVARAWTLAP